jgi:hypothetical protein
VSKISVANPDDEQEALVDADFDTLATALYVRTAPPPGSGSASYNASWP